MANCLPRYPVSRWRLQPSTTNYNSHQGRRQVTRADELIAYIETNRVALTWRARRFVGDEAEDVLQDAALRAWTHVGSFRGDATVGTWFVRVLINTALMRARHNQVALRFSGPPVRVDLRTTPANAEDLVYLREIEEWVDQMSPAKQRAYQKVINGDPIGANAQVFWMRKELWARASE